MTGGMRPTDDDARIEEAAVHFAGSPDLFEKYLRAFHGATVIKWYGPNQVTDYTYVAYDTPAWVKAIGFDDVISPRLVGPQTRSWNPSIPTVTRSRGWWPLR